MAAVSAPRLLAFDTATELSCVVVCTPAGMLARADAGGPQASMTLLPTLLGLLAEADCRLNDLDAIAYGRGPGAFTGLRTACSVAQGLAFGAGKPVLALDSLMLVAEAVRPALAAQGVDRVWIVQDARMDEVYAAEYRWGEASQRWATLTAPALYPPEVLNLRWAECPPCAVAGSALAALRERLQPGEAQVLPGPSPRQRAEALGALAAAAWADGPRLDAAEALPLYLRDKVAATTAEREALRAAQALAR